MSSRTSFLDTPSCPSGWMLVSNSAAALYPAHFDQMNGRLLTRCPHGNDCDRPLPPPPLLSMQYLFAREMVPRFPYVFGPFIPSRAHSSCYKLPWSVLFLSCSYKMASEFVCGWWKQFVNSSSGWCLSKCPQFTRKFPIHNWRNLSSLVNPWHDMAPCKFNCGGARNK